MEFVNHNFFIDTDISPVSHNCIQEFVFRKKFKKINKWKKTYTYLVFYATELNIFVELFLLQLLVAVDLLNKTPIS